MIKALLLAIVLSQIKEVSPQSELKIKIQTTKEDIYYLITKNQPLTVKADGPTWIRVYTRIPLRADDRSIKTYKLILQENDLKEKFITMESERSKTAKLDKNRLTKWRSFYINVPKGTNSYRFLIWSSPSDSMLLKFAHEAPASWKDITPTDYSGKLEATEDEKIIDYYEATTSKPVVLEITGPQKLKIIARLNYSIAMANEQMYSVTAKENGKIMKNSTFRAYHSETTAYHDRKDIVPSNPHSFYLNLRKGKHRLEFFIGGAEATSVGLRFLVQQK